MKQRLTNIILLSLLMGNSSSYAIKFAEPSEPATGQPESSVDTSAMDPIATDTKKQLEQQAEEYELELKLKLVEEYGFSDEQADEFIKNASSVDQKQIEKLVRDKIQEQQGQATQTPEAAEQLAAEQEAPAPQTTKRKKRKKISIKEQMRNEAYEQLLEEVLPVSPEQIIRVRKLFEIAERAKVTPTDAPPTPHFTSTVVNLEPGSIPPVIRLSAGFVTSMLFVDSTGSPWPLSAYSLGDPKSFNIQWDSKSNTLFIQSSKLYAHANMAVQLHGLNTPIMLTLVSGQKNVDFRIDLQVAGRGPNAKPLLAKQTYTDAGVNPTLINILDGVPPKSSLKLDVSGGHGEAWAHEKKLYFRTRLTVLSPAWTAHVTSPDGTNVYELMLTPYILASGNGKTVDIKLTGL